MSTPAPKENQGCLSIILRLFPWVHQAVPRVKQLPYAQRDDFLSQAEHSFYSVLKNMLGVHFTICPKVSLNDVFYVKAGDVSNRGGATGYRNKIDRKHIDFLVCTPKTMVPVLGIELDDKSHLRADRRERDAFVDQVFATAGLPILHIPVATAYDTRELARLLRPHLESKREPGAAAGVTASTGDVKENREVGPAADRPAASEDPTCPKCGNQMVLRTARSGPNAGKQFWGCMNYPQCRGVVPMEGGRPTDERAESRS